MFSLAIPRITEVFVRKVTDTKMHNDLQNCKQTQWDKDSRTWDMRSSSVYHEDFCIRMTMLEYFTGMDLAALFFRNHTETMRLTMEVISGFQLSIRPKDESMDNVFERVGTVRDFAIQADKSTAAYTKAFVNTTGMKTLGAPWVSGYF